ncbi:cysteine rich repeat-containing protein [Ancylobacter mangrovi]|nr:cysteine rich repeat-containing protein [Ancylobacter mangrovi]MCS0504832.1 cysteine rich repeat-containing protein [Ancylobacter mangrovi]
MTLVALVLAASASFAHAQEGDFAKYCKADIERLCQGIQPGGGNLLKCLKSHSKEMSVGCAQALQKLKG